MARARDAPRVASCAGPKPCEIPGTHAYSPGEGVAVLGNIATATRFRAQGLCTALTAFLCDELSIRGCGLIGLHVASGNAPAIACYRRCGFVKDRSVFTMLARKKAAD